MHGAERGLGESQVFVVDLQRGVESMPLPGPGVEAQGDLVEFVLTVDRQVRALGQVLTQQAVGVLVAAALPGAVRVGEVDRHTGAQGQRVVVRSSNHFTSQAAGNWTRRDLIPRLCGIHYVEESL